LSNDRSVAILARSEPCHEGLSRLSAPRGARRAALAGAPRRARGGRDHGRGTGGPALCRYTRVARVADHQRRPPDKLPPLFDATLLWMRGGRMALTGFERLAGLGD